MGPTWLIAVKDLRQRARDRSLFILAFVAPLVLAFVFSVVFGGLDDGGDRISFDIGLVDLDGGDQAESFRAVLDDVASSGLIEVSSHADPRAGRDAVDAGEVDATIILPPGFSTAFATGTSVEIQVVGSVDAPLATSVATSLARGYAARSGTAALAGFTAAATGVIAPDEIEELAHQVAAAPPLAGLTSIVTESASVDLTTQMVAGMSVFFVFFVAGTAVTGVLEERQAGTLPRLLVSPVPRAAIILGKATAAVVAGVAALVALMIASTLIMGARWGHPLGAVLLAAAAVLAATGIMSMVGGLARTAEQAGNLQSIVAVSLAMLGGSFGLMIPSPDSLWGRLAKLTPNRWFLDGVDQLAAGGVAEVVPAVLVLLAMAVVTGTVGAALAGKVLR